MRGTPPPVKLARRGEGSSVGMEGAVAAIDMDALQASLLASLKVSTQQMLDAQSPQALASGCTKALERFVQDTNILKKQQSALHERVARFEITAAKHHAELMVANVAHASGASQGSAAPTSGSAPAAPAAGASGSSADHQAGGSGGGQAVGQSLGGTAQHVVLLKFKKPVLREWAEGVEKTSRSHIAPHLSAPPYEGPSYRDYLTQIYPTFELAAECEKALKGKVFDRDGAPVGVIHNNCKADLPPEIQRRVKAMAVFYGAFEKLLKDGEVLKQTHLQRGDPKSSIFVAICRENGEVRELATIKWEDDGSQVRPLAVGHFNADLLPDARRVITALVIG